MSRALRRRKAREKVKALASGGHVVAGQVVAPIDPERVGIKDSNFDATALRSRAAATLQLPELPPGQAKQPQTEEEWIEGSLQNEYAERAKAGMDITSHALAELILRPRVRAHSMSHEEMMARVAVDIERAFGRALTDDERSMLQVVHAMTLVYQHINANSFGARVDEIQGVVCNELAWQHNNLIWTEIRSGRRMTAIAQRELKSNQTELWALVNHAKDAVADARGQIDELRAEIAELRAEKAEAVA